METKSPRAWLIELVGAFGLVLFSSGLVCINQTTTVGQPSATSTLTMHQPGVFGVALGQGLILAALLALTAPISGGYLNPAITLMLWVFSRIETRRAAGLIAAQLLGGLLAALCLRFALHPSLLQAAQYGAPHVNPLPFPTLGQSAQVAGTLIELLLTFFLVFAIFGLADADALKLGIVTGMIMTACALFAVPLTGAALNPARWLGPTLLEAHYSTRAAWADSLVYLAGPILGAVLGGTFVFKVFVPAEKT